MNKSKNEINSNTIDLAVKTQKEIIDKLDKLIKEAEDKNNNQQAKGNGEKSDSKKGQPNQPADDSDIMTDVFGKGKVDNKKIEDFNKLWGKLPEQERVRLIQEFSKKVPPKYQEDIEKYYKELNKSKRD